MSITITNQQNLLTQAAGESAGEMSPVAKKSTQLGQADFLRLLTVQLQNQDPMSPMSDMDFIASMSSFSSVDAISSLSTNFESFMSEQSGLNSSMLETLGALADGMGDNKELQLRLTGQSYLGKEVTIEDPVKGSFSGTVDRVELIEKLNLDGTTEYLVGLVVNEEIFPMELVTAVAERPGVLSSVGNAVASTLNVVTGGI
jgi:flagellar hook assembly protein FlgD